MTAYIPWTFTGDTISLVLTETGERHAIPESHPNFNKIYEALKSKDFLVIPDLVDIPRAIVKYVGGRVTVEDGVLSFDGKEIHNYLSNRIFDMMEEGFPVEPFINHLAKWEENPSFRSREQGYEFLEKSGHPIAEDGDFYAWRWVTDDYKDAHTRSMDNSVGAIVEMPRSQVDDDPTRTCSAGLHVCSRHYGKFSSRLMLVKINPRDVVAVPTDYNAAKMRVCRFEVVKEVVENKAFEFHSAVFDHDSYNFD